MKDEIKEILDWLSDDDIYVEDYGYQYKRISLRESKLLLDYITNLREENKELKENLEVIDKSACFWEDTSDNYKSRNEKAIEYINKFWKNESYYEDIDNCMKFATMNEWNKNDLINILQGSDK